MSHQEAAKVMTERAGLEPRVGIVLGSGLGAVADAVSDPTALDYSELPGFPEVTVEGHGGVFVDGNGGVDVGSNKVNISFLNAAFDLVGSYGAAGLVQNSWREVPAAQY